MKHFLNSSTQKALYNLCCEHGFTAQGKAFFRVYADSILQVIGFQHERVFNHHSLNIGLMSMYSKADNDTFSAKTSLLCYSICCLDNCASAISLSENNGITTFHIRSPESQLCLLKEKGFEWLDSIKTQEKLLEAINYLETVTYKSIIWNNDKKLAPLLAVKNYERADYVIASILNQHLGSNAISSPPWIEQDFLYYSNCFPNRDMDYLHLHKLITEWKTDLIEAYLEKNYLDNTRRLKVYGDGSVC